MKILTAIVSVDNAKKLAATTLTWAPRAGFDLRIFIPSEDNLLNYLHAIKDVNYQEFLDISLGQVVVNNKPEKYAKKLHYDLILYLPDYLRAWKRNNNREKMVLEYVAEIAKVRKEMGANPRLREHVFDNGAILKRL